ncbi:hypothetical protein ACHAW5_005058 [Stephanodiscus triporus]|uniref:Uncharacterized protein n=1 Tax=Stephanodiscus triporus TaxID=2934178 RepID=A0ABD3NEX6_9STRA
MDIEGPSRRQQQLGGVRHRRGGDIRGPESSEGRLENYARLPRWRNRRVESGVDEGLQPAERQGAEESEGESHDRGGPAGSRSGRASHGHGTHAAAQDKFGVGREGVANRRGSVEGGNGRDAGGVGDHTHGRRRRRGRDQRANGRRGQGEREGTQRRERRDRHNGLLRHEAMMIGEG